MYERVVISIIQKYTQGILEKKKLSFAGESRVWRKFELHKRLVKENYRCKKYGTYLILTKTSNCGLPSPNTMK